MEILAISLLVALVSAVAVPANHPNPFAVAESSNSTITARDVADRDSCGDSLFIDKTSDGSPDIGDCAYIIYYARSDYPQADSYAVYLPLVTEGFYRIASHGSCIFGVRNAYYGDQHGNVNIGRYDVADLIDSAVQKFGRDSRVGAEGAMTCKPFGDGVGWAVYHT